MENSFVTAPTTAQHGNISVLPQRTQHTHKDVLVTKDSIIRIKTLTTAIQLGQKQGLSSNDVTDTSYASYTYCLVISTVGKGREHKT